MPPKEHQDKSLAKKTLVTIVALSLFFGVLGGAAGGLVMSTLYGNNFNQWLQSYFKTIVGSNLADQQQKTLKEKTNSQNTDESSVEAVSKVSPAVVSIIVSKQLQQFYNYTGPNTPFDDLFNQNFPFDNSDNNSPNPDSKTPAPTEKQRIGGGTGFIVSSDGLILTNKHVVADTEAEYSVVMNNAKSYTAKVVARDTFNDLAFIKIEARDLPTVELGNSDEVKIGQSVMAIGFSLGEYSNSVTKGIISGLGRNIVAGNGGQTEKLENVFQTDAAINPGNSGGPLVNLHGQVIGINTAINQEGQLVGFAIPISVAKTVLDNFQKNGRIVRAYLGVRYIQIDPTVKQKNNLKIDYGALIVKGSSQSELAVVPGSPADKAGLVENDIILEVDGAKITSDNNLSKIISKHQPGDSLNLKILHQGEERMLTLKLEEYKE
jgi:serine protease Do